MLCVADLCNLRHQLAGSVLVLQSFPIVTVCYASASREKEDVVREAVRMEAAHGGQNCENGPDASGQSFCLDENRFWYLPGEKTPETIIRPENYRFSAVVYGGSRMEMTKMNDVPKKCLTSEMGRIPCWALRAECP